MPGVYNSTTQGLVEKNSQGLQSLFQTPSFGSQGSFLIRSLYWQLCGYSWGWGLPPWSKQTLEWQGLGSSSLKENRSSPEVSFQPCSRALDQEWAFPLHRELPHGSLLAGSLNTTGTENNSAPGLVTPNSRVTAVATSHPRALPVRLVWTCLQDF